jgi:RTA1 like protein.
MELGRIVELVDGERYLFVRRRWLTGIFVTGDVLSFFMQGGGGGLMGSDKPDSRATGSHVIVGGLFVQIVFFGCFIITAVLFHMRLHRAPTQRVLTHQPPYLRHLLALYATSLLIFVRSIVRVVEFIQGLDGYVISHEIFIYLFDAVLMLGVMLIMNWVHPSEVTTYLTGGKMSKGLRLVEYSTAAQTSA